MSKKTLILSQKQLDEICGGDSSYLDGLALNPDKGNIDATEVTADGGVDKGYADETTADDFAHQICTPWRGGKLNGVGGNRNTPLQMHEMTKRQWEAKIGLYEAEEHGNARLKNRRFGGTMDNPGKTYDATKQTLYRYRKAAKEGNSQTMREIEKNWPQVINAAKQYNTAERTDKIIQQGKPEGTKIKSSPKTGSGSSSKKNGPMDGVLTS